MASGLFGILNIRSPNISLLLTGNTSSRANFSLGDSDTIIYPDLITYVNTSIKGQDQVLPGIKGSIFLHILANLALNGNLTSTIDNPCLSNKSFRLRNF